MAKKNIRIPKTNKPKLTIKEKRAAKKAKKAGGDIPLLPASQARRPTNP